MFPFPFLMWLLKNLSIHVTHIINFCWAGPFQKNIPKILMAYTSMDDPETVPAQSLLLLTLVLPRDGGSQWDCFYVELKGKAKSFRLLSFLHGH